VSGLDLYTVGGLLGHADTASTERHAYLAAEDARGAACRASGSVHSVMTKKFLADGVDSRCEYSVI